MQVIIYKNKTGNVSLCVPTGELPIEEVLKKDCPAGSAIVESNKLPEQHYDFFDAWELENNTVSVNFNKAKEITKNRLRAERESLFKAQDLAFQIALEKGESTSGIAAEKQRLRDVTKLVDTVTTLEELKKLHV